MSITTNAKVYTKDSNPSSDTSLYFGPAKTASVKDSILFGRTAPKPSKDFAGVSRSRVKTVKNELVNGVYRDLIAETTFSFAIGTTQGQITALRADHAATVSHAVVTALVDTTSLPSA